MKLKLSQVHYIASKIARDISNTSYIEIITNTMDIEDIAKQYLQENIKEEYKLDEEVSTYIEENIYEIQAQGVDERRFFYLLKKKLAETRGFIFNWEDRLNVISHQIIDDLIDKSIINFKTPEAMVKNLIFKSIDSFAKFERDIEHKIYEQLKNYKKKIIVGSEEYDLIFEQMFKEELRKQGLL